MSDTMVVKLNKIPGFPGAWAQVTLENKTVDDEKFVVYREVHTDPAHQPLMGTNGSQFRRAVDLALLTYLVEKSKEVK